MKRSLILAAVCLTAGLMAAPAAPAKTAAKADAKVEISSGFWSTNGSLKGSKDAKGVITYTIVKENAVDKAGKKSQWNAQIMPMHKGLPAGKYKLEFTLKCSEAITFELIIFDGKSAAFGRKHVKLAAGKAEKVAMEFTVPAAFANKAFRLPCIPAGCAKKGTVITLSDYKVSKI